MAADGLGRLGEASPEVLQALLAALRDGDEFVRGRAAESLGKLGWASPEAVLALLTALRDGDSWVGWHTAEGLGSFRIEDGEMLSKVLEVLSRKMHDIDFQDDSRVNKLSAARRLVEGRPLPGYRWVPIGERQAYRETR